jgi:hypothetical protein
MCTASKPKVQQMPAPPPPPTVVTEDQAALDERARERARAGQRRGRRSTILAGATSGDTLAPTTQTKTVLGG